MEIAKPGILGRFLGAGEVEFPYVIPTFALGSQGSRPVKILATPIWDDDQKIPKPSKIVFPSLVKSPYVSTQWSFLDKPKVLVSTSEKFETTRPFQPKSLGIRQFQDHHPAMTFTTTNLRCRKGGILVGKK